MSSTIDRRRVLVMAAMTLLPGCAQQGSPEDERARAAESDSDIKIAVAWPWEAHADLYFAQGLEMAADEINGAGGVLGRHISLVTVDDQESVNEGRLVAQRLAGDPEIMAIVGHLQSYVTVPAAAIYDLAGLLLVAPTSTSAELTSKGYERVFRATLTDQVIGRAMAEFAELREYRRVAIYYVRNGYGRALANAFEERSYDLDIGVVARQSYDPNQDFGQRALEPVLQEWRQMDLDAVFLAGQVPVAGRVITGLRSAGIDAPILGSDAMSAPSLITEGGFAAEGTVVASLFHPVDPRPAVQRFVSDFRARNDHDPDTAAALGYDAVRLLAHAMETAGSPAPERVADAMRGVRAWKGVTGSFTFDEKGDLVGRQPVHLVVRNGAFDLLPPQDQVREARMIEGGR